MSKVKGRSIELFFVDGTPDGMVAASIPFQWSGHVLVTQRTQLKEALSRPEAQRTGVYILVGDKDGKLTAYIGETDALKQRLTRHASEKDWWDRAILITSGGEPLNKAHARYLEYRMLSDAQRVNKVVLDNTQEASERPLSEAAQVHMEGFLESLYLVLPALRFDFLSAQTTDDSAASLAPAPSGAVFFTFEIARHGIKARARWEDGKFIVEAGSMARQSWSSKALHATYQELHAELVAQGVLGDQPGDRGPHRVFTKSYVFRSTSAAAAVVSGRPASGPKSWILEGTAQNYGDWEASQLRALDQEEDL